MTWFIIGFLIYYLVGWIYLIRDCCKQFGEIRFNILVAITIGVWVVWPAVFLSNVFGGLGNKVVFRCRK